MQKSKVTKIVYRIAAALIILTLITSLLASGLLARFLSTDDNNDAARVAYWSVKVVDKKGTDIGLNQGTTHLNADDSGNSFFQVSNKSEVAAMFSADSSISLKFTADTFKADTTITSWDFLKNGSEVVNNPVEFNVYIYNCKVSELDDYLTYTNKTDSTDVKNLADYNALTDEQKKLYTEDVVIPSGSTIKETLVMSTTDDTLAVTKETVDGVPYFYLTKKIANAQNYTFPVGSGDYTFRIEWKVSGSTNFGGSYNTKFNAYYVIELAEYNNNKAKYSGLVSKTEDEGNVVLVSNESITDTSAFAETVDVLDEGVKKSKTFVIAYKECDYFEYLIYTSSLGGQPTFTDLDFVYEELETRSSGIYKTEYSKLLKTSAIATIKKRTWDDAKNGSAAKVSYNTIMKYREKLLVLAYEDFLGSRTAFENTLGYLSIGLDCSIVYNLKVVQVD